MFFGLFGKQKNDSEEALQSLPGTEVYFHPTLVQDLLSDHVHLLELFGKIDAANKKGNTAQTIEALNIFSNELRQHLLIENTRLYIYLRHSLANMPKEAKIAREFQQEMRGIGKVLNQFVTKFSSDTWNDEEREAFGSQLSDIGGVLIQRIETEEEMLYPLYRDPSHFA
jgi:hypothetical protein